jgi:RNA polymerase sigma-70 factor (ECF subfamily)
MGSDDAELVAGIRSGSEQAFNQMIDRHQRAVRGFLRRLMANAADADDIAQETFLAAWQDIHGYRGGATLRSWLCAIAWRKAKGAQRAWVRRLTRDARYHAERARGHEPESSAEDRLAVQQALLTLPIKQRAVVVLCLAEGFSHAEAADTLGFPLGTVKSHVSRGKALLIRALGEDLRQDTEKEAVSG